MARLRVGVLFGGRSAEHEVSILSAKDVLRALAVNFDVVPIGITREGRFLVGAEPVAALEAGGEEETALRPAERLPDGEVKAVLSAVDVVFPLLHGPYGEDGTVQGLLELAGIPYVGSGVLGSAVGMDKALMKATFEQAGLPVCRWFLVREKDFRDRPEAVAAEAERLGYPLFVKPANLGSSVGITKVRAPEGLAAALAEAFRYDRRAVVEEGLTARELECGVLGNDEPEASVVGEVIPSHEFYDYEAKYVAGSRVEIPARIPPEVASEVRRLAVQAFLAIDAAGLARVDFFYTHDGRVLVNEINTMPGFTPYSMYPKMWEATGLSYAELLARLVELGLERHRQKSAKEARRSP